VAHLAADAVVGTPQQARRLDAALEHEILDQPADRIVGERRHDSGAQPEAAAQPARDVVLASTLPGLERPRRGDATLARVEAEHHLAERDEVVAALLLRAQLHHAAASTAARARC